MLKYTKSQTHMHAKMVNLRVILVRRSRRRRYSFHAKREKHSGTLHAGPIYFHYLPHPKSIDHQGSWGYWSLNADADTNVTLDDEQPTIDGFELSHW